jgi:hypothetical protein
VLWILSNSLELEFVLWKFEQQTSLDAAERWMLSCLVWTWHWLGFYIQGYDVTTGMQ